MRCGECLPEEVKRKTTGGEGREVKRLGDPRRPTEMEVEDHERTHLPFRNWCSHCVNPRARNAPHRSGAEEPMEEVKAPRVSIDYFPMSKEDEESS